MKKNLTDGRDYEYHCNKCDTSTVVKRSMDDRDKPQSCEACGSKDTVRKFSLAYIKVR